MFSAVIGNGWIFRFEVLCYVFPCYLGGVFDLSFCLRIEAWLFQISKKKEKISLLKVVFISKQSPENFGLIVSPWGVWLLLLHFFQSGDLNRIRNHSKLAEAS